MVCQWGEEDGENYVAVAWVVTTHLTASRNTAIQRELQTQCKEIPKMLEVKQMVAAYAAVA